MLRVGFGHVKTLAVRNKLISKLYQLSGCAVSPTAYRILCLRFAHLLFAASTPLLRNGRKTQYRRVVSPYPAGTLTQQDTPSLSWRCNVQAEQPSPAHKAAGQWSGSSRGVGKETFSVI